MPRYLSILVAGVLVASCGSSPSPTALLGPDPLWELDAGDNVGGGTYDGSAIAATDTGVIVGTLPYRGHPTFTIYDLVDRTQRWSVSIPGHHREVVLADDDIVVVRPEEHRLHVLDAQTGESLWSFRVGTWSATCFS